MPGPSDDRARGHRVGTDGADGTRRKERMRSLAPIAMPTTPSSGVAGGHRPLGFRGCGRCRSPGGGPRRGDAGQLAEDLVHHLIARPALQLAPEAGLPDRLLERAAGSTTADVSTRSPFTSASSRQWAGEQGLHPVTASRWLHSGTPPVPARRVGHLILGAPRRDRPLACPLRISVTTWIVRWRVSPPGGPGGARRRADRDRDRLGVEREASAAPGPAAGGDRDHHRGRPSEVDDDLVRDVTELLSRLGARPDGRRAAAHRAARAMAALQHDGA